jgi:hypothetical protein
MLLTGLVLDTHVTPLSSEVRIAPIVEPDTVIVPLLSTAFMVAEAPYV